MATIKIKGRVDPVIVSNAIARMVKQRRFGDENKNIAKALSTDLCDLGDAWSGEYGRISEIELDKEIVHKPEETETPLTPEEIEAGEKARKETGDWLRKQGIIKNKN